MESFGLVELYAKARTAEAELRPKQPVPPEGPGFWARRRQGMAKTLVRLGVRLDADASRAAIGSFATRLNGSDA
jgi:hypothetical protein